MDVSIVGVVPCYNEELTIGKIISDFRKIVPEAKIYVFDNNSTDKTAEIAKSLEIAYWENTN
jgi:glycosyltransferase involved in cell wall biosynthesis